MKSDLTITVSIEHNEPLTTGNIETMEYFVKCGIEEIIDGSQDYKVERITLAEQKPKQSSMEEAAFTDL